jgi:hypothetical protein
MLWALFLFGGFILGPTRDNRRISRPARLASSFVLMLAGWSWWLAIAGSDRRFYAGMIAAGITLGFVGDLFLADVITQRRSRAIMGGIGAFALGHVFYITGILFLARRFHLTAPAPMWGSLVAFWLFAAVGWYGVVMRGQEKRSPLHWAALPYALLLATTAGLALGLALQSALFFPLALGAFLFLFSDLILAGALFGGLHWPLHHDIVWLTYGPGQMLIVYGIAFLLL